MKKLIPESYQEFLKEKQIIVNMAGDMRTIDENKVNEDEDDGRPKNISNALGPKQERFVIEGEEVKNNVDKIMKILDKQDKDHKMAFYEKTGKIVGALKTHALENVQRDLKSIDKEILIYAKPGVR
jgi:tryptophanyl-tRNA synthetase